MKLKEQIRINVSKADIKQGARVNCQSCPIALAINRAIPNAKAAVGVTFGDATLRSKRVRFNLPKAAQNFIERFDSSLTVGPLPRPFSFRISTLK